jgi:hypothetical protein
MNTRIYNVLKKLENEKMLNNQNKKSLRQTSKNVKNIINKEIDELAKKVANAFFEGGNLRDLPNNLTKLQSFRNRRRYARSRLHTELQRGRQTKIIRNELDNIPGNLTSSIWGTSVHGLQRMANLFGGRKINGMDVVYNVYKNLSR